ncbi:UNVERIFIED_ORG: hypothetical protein OKW25_004699 [Pseudomonas vranovensis]|nr:hypothetical protein [Pseudomonas vranovensis]
MSLLTATRLHLCSFGLLAGLSLAATTAYADEATDQALHKGRWQGMAAMANLYLNDATPAEFMDAGDKEKSEHDNYAGALAFYLTAARLDPKNAFAAYQAAAALSSMDSPELAAQYLDEARERGFWQAVILKEDDELEPMKNDPAYQKLLQTAEKNYPTQAKDAGLAAFSIPEGKAPAGGWPVVVWLAGFGTEGVNGTNMRADLVGDKAVLVALNGTLKRDAHQFMWQQHSVEPTEQAVAAALNETGKRHPHRPLESRPDRLLPRCRTRGAPDRPVPAELQRRSTVVARRLQDPVHRAEGQGQAPGRGPRCPGA